MIFERETSKLRTAIYDKLKEGFDDEFSAKLTKQVRDIVCDIEGWIQYDLQESLADNLSYFVQQSADRAVEALLAGNEKELRRYLTCDEGAWNGREKEHSVIHGRLFEPQCFETRKAIVNAHAELLKNERILDLESQVASLVDQNNRQKAEIERLREELRDYKPF
jgi:tRNA 2-selenouridine synthase SelU